MFQSRFSRRIAEIQEKYPIEVTMTADPELIEQINKEMQAIMDEELWSTSDITKLYGLSRQNLNNISKRHQIPGRFKLGESIVVYAVEAAKPWFDEYVARNGGKSC